MHRYTITDPSSIDNIVRAFEGHQPEKSGTLQHPEQNYRRGHSQYTLVYSGSTVIRVEVADGIIDKGNY